MNHATVSSMTPTLSDALLPRLSRAMRVTASVLLSLRHSVRQRPAMQYLLSEANRVESSDPLRSAALRKAAAQLVG